MGWHAARKLLKCLDNTRQVLAIEMLAAARAIELRAPHKPAVRTAKIVNALRQVVPGVGPDRFLSPELRAANELLKSDIWT